MVRKGPASALAASITLALSVASAGVATAAPRTQPPPTVADNTPLSVTMTLAGKNDAGLANYAESVANPRSPEYRKFLSRSELQQRFGAPADRIQRVQQWAQDAGFRVENVDATGTRVRLGGSARAAENAFKVTLRNTVTKGVKTLTPDAVPSKPAPVAGDIASVSGLGKYAFKPMHVTTPKPAPAAAPNQSCSQYWGENNNTDVPQSYPAGFQSNVLCGYNGPQLRAMYGLKAEDTGVGQTVVIVGAFSNPNALAEANQTFAQTGVPPLTPDQFQVKTYAPSTGDNGCDRKGWEQEENLDIQAIHAVAPAVKIVYVAAPDCTQTPVALSQAIDDETLNASIISNSWGQAGENTDTQYLSDVNNTLARGAAMGIGTYFATGDNGDNSGVGGPPSAGFPASSPYATSVGGTSTALKQDNSLAFETGWESGGKVLQGGKFVPLTPSPFIAGANGGPSQVFDEPTWQQGVVPDRLSGGKRVQPDISALGDPFTGFAVGGTNSSGKFDIRPIGGTSLSTPIVSALVAIGQSRNNSTVGQLAPSLYAKVKAGKPITSDVDHVSAGMWSNGISAQAPKGDYLIDVDAGVQSLHTTPDYDNVTGLGRPGPEFLAGVTS